MIGLGIGVSWGVVSERNDGAPPEPTEPAANVLIDDTTGEPITLTTGGEPITVEA